MNFAKLKKSTIAKTITTITLSISLVFCNAIPVFASTAVDQESLYPILRNSTLQYLYPVTGTTKTIPRLSNIADILAMYADQSTLNQKTTYTYLSGTIKGYIDGIETGLDNVNTKLTNISGYVDGVETGISNINTNVANIKGYVDGLEGYVDNLETYVDNVETLLTTNNTRLNDIKSAIQNISTYNYTSILTDIQTNMLHVPTIDQYVQSIQDSIGYGNSVDNVLSNLNSVNGHLGNIYGDMSYWDNSSANSMGIAESVYKTYKYLLSYTQNTSAKLRYRNNQYGNIIDTTSNNGTYNINGFAYPTITTDSLSSGDQYRYKYNTSSDFTMLDGLENLSIIGNFTLGKIFTPNTRYTYMVYDPVTNAMTPYKNTADYTISALSVMDVLTHYGQYILETTSKLQYMLADDDAIQAKNANKAQEQAVLTNFTGQGGASASADDFGDIASSVASVNSGLNTGVSISNIFNIYNNRDGYGFWSVETQNELNTTNANRSYKSNRGSSTPLYDSKLSEIYSYMGVNND